MKPVLAHLRTLGYINAIYIDDMYLQGETIEECAENTATSLRLLQELGFIINQKKSVIVSSQQIVMLGFVICSRSMTVRLTEEKASKTKDLCLELLSMKQPTIRFLAQVIGKICSSFPGVEFGQMHYRELERLKTKSLVLARGNFDASCSLTEAAKTELQWWGGNIETASKQISHGKPDFFLKTDASKSGWGAHVPGKVSSTGGRWKPEEAELHINCLEMIAALFGMKCYCQDMRNVHVRIEVDNTTAVSYINAFGGTKSKACDRVAREIWQWCQERNIWLSACHIAGVLNVEADEASRCFNDRTEWMLDKDVFRQLTNLLDRPDIDLFASRLNRQLDRYVSWKPDPEAEAVDAFMADWSMYDYAYAFPPFSIIARCLAKLAEDQAEKMLFVVPCWPTQPWFTQILSMAIAVPILLQSKAPLMLPFVSLQKPPAKLQLMAVICSGKPGSAEGFQRTLPRSSKQVSARPRGSNTVASLRAGGSFVTKGRLISFNQV